MEPAGAKKCNLKWAALIVVTTVIGVASVLGLLIRLSSQTSTHKQSQLLGELRELDFAFINSQLTELKQLRQRVDVLQQHLAAVGSVPQAKAESTPVTAKNPPDDNEMLLQRVNKTFTDIAETEIIKGSWALGCQDLPPLLPFIRAMGYRNKDVTVVIDIGAHKGSDAEAIFTQFALTEGMCRGLSEELLQVQVLSVEAEPTTHCDLLKTGQKLGLPDAKFMALNIAVSNSIGVQSYQHVEGGEQSTLTGTAQKSNWVDQQCLSSCLQRNVDSSTHLGASECSSKCAEQYIQRHNVITEMQQCKKNGGTKLSQVQVITVDALYFATARWRRNSDIFLLKVDAECFSSNVVLGAVGIMKQKKVRFVLFEICTTRHLERVTEHAQSIGYICFLLTPSGLLPLDSRWVQRTGGKRWWYKALTNITTDWWANALCGIKGHSSTRELWNMVHANRQYLIDGYDLLEYE